MNDMSNMPQVNPEIAPGVYQGIPNEAYHAGPGISKSGLWTIYQQSPAHFAFGERETTAAFDFGDAAHSAILEPDEFERRVIKGPEDRRGNKWKDAEAEATNLGKLLLTSGDFEAVLAIRDSVHANPFLNGLITQGVREIEASGYWIDPETGMLCRCRPDLYRVDLGIMVDIKTAGSAKPDEFARSVVNYGYHAQEAFYSDGYRALGRNVEGFVFVAFEKKAPYAASVFELPPSIVDEGREIMRQSLQTYAGCFKEDHWPAYDEGVTELQFPRWAYKLTPAPSGIGDDA